MSNIKLAQEAIEAEIKHAQEGLMFYQTRVASLEAALSKLATMDTASPEPGKIRRTTAAPALKQEKQVKEVKVRRGRKAPAATESDDEKLPSTGKDFWPGLLGTEPKTSAEIYDAAVQALGIKPSKGQAKKLAQRQANALSILGKNGVISSTGSGRTRQYFKP